MIGLVMIPTDGAVLSEVPYKFDSVDTSGTSFATQDTNHSWLISFF